MSPVVDATTEVGARSVSSVFAAAINRADLDGATNCFTRDACLLTPDSTAVQGRDRIRLILRQLIDREVKIEICASSLLLAGELALGAEHWRIHATDAHGTLYGQDSQPILVTRYVEGAWKLAIATPWGLGLPMREC